MQMKESTKAQNNNPLLHIPEAQILIYATKIVQYQPKDTQNSREIPTDPPLKTLYFTDSDLAFDISIDQKRVQLKRVANSRMELEFVVDMKGTLIMIREILRKKLCELGFESKFQIIEEIGKGAMAQVYLVRRKSDKKLFAAKVISIKKANDKVYETFIQEAKILRAVKNPYVIEMESLYISKKALISVLEYLTGGTLLSELKTRVIQTPKDRWKAIKDITQGIEHLRQKRIVHRDLKLQNILVRLNQDGSKNYVITDFGLSNWIGDLHILYEKCGTPGYIAPEVLKAPRNKCILSHSSDIFSLGVLAHFIFMMQPLFCYDGNPKHLLDENRKALFSLKDKKYHSLIPIQYNLLVATLEINPEKRMSSREIIDTFWHKIDESIYDNPKKPVRKNWYLSNKESLGSSRAKSKGSVTVREDKQPAMNSKGFCVNVKSVSDLNKHKPKTSSSLFQKVWDRFSPLKKQPLKRKESHEKHKTDMQSFVL